MTSIERTTYPRFERLITAHEHELHPFSAPPREEAAWAQFVRKHFEAMVFTCLAFLRGQLEDRLRAAAGGGRRLQRLPTVEAVRVERCAPERASAPGTP
ncbi:hypothetical protein [Streptomyces sp. NPDC093149]|uniref:hypothetical protein n=1 Tax=Streptomyces sp. NPDC093149 TaxID=3366031 RepID=UPI00381E87CF